MNAPHLYGRLPTTADVVYSPEESRFLKAMQDYKEQYQRPFPTWREVLWVVKTLGYRLSVPPCALPEVIDGAHDR